MQQTIELHKGQKFARYLIENSSAETIPVIFRAVTRVQKSDGTEVNDETKEIQVFPPQMLLASGQKKSVRVTFKGNDKFSQEKSYRIIAQQVPVNLSTDKKKTGIKMLLKFQNALYIRNEDYKSQLKISEYEIKNNKLHVFVTNSGKAHQYLYNVNIKFKEGKKSIDIPKEELEKLEGQNILANTTRHFIFNPVLGLKNNWEGQITFD